MSILAKIFDKIFPWADGKAPSPAKPTIEQHNEAVTGTAANRTTAPISDVTQKNAQITTPISEVDVERILSDLAEKNAQQLNWRTSIVDLLKLLDLDSSLQARKELALELEYAGDTNDSASMNIWLHREVMKTLAANGGKVPAELKD
jgi:hypothetical protein